MPSATSPRPCKKDERVSGRHRVEQAAGDGEVWASSTVRDMMLGGSTNFTDVGEHALKGIDGLWRLFSVAAS